MKTSILHSLDNPVFDLKPCVIYFYLEKPEPKTYTAIVYDNEFVISFRVTTPAPYRYSEQDIQYCCIKKAPLPSNIKVESLKTLMGILQDYRSDQGIQEFWGLKILNTMDTSVPLLLDHLHRNEEKPVVHTSRTRDSLVILAEVLLARREAGLLCPTYAWLMEQVDGLPFEDAIAVFEQYANIIFDDGEDV